MKVYLIGEIDNLIFIPVIDRAYLSFEIAEKELIKRGLLGKACIKEFPVKEE